MKGVLAYSTISHLGLITLLLGLNSSLALVAAIFHMVNHATFKASLFMAAGIVDHETGTRDLPAVRPVQGHADHGHAGHGGGRVHGGRAAQRLHLEEMFFAETTFVSGDWTTRVGLPLAAPWPAPSAWPIRCASSCRCSSGRRPPTCRARRMSRRAGCCFPARCWCSCACWSACSPAYTVGPFPATAAQSILGADMPEYSLAVWHGVNLPLVMSVVAMTAGVVLYLLRAHQQANPGRVPFIYRFDGRRSSRRCWTAPAWRPGCCAGWRPRACRCRCC